MRYESVSHFMTQVAFVCAENAGRSQMATAFAERERDERGLDVELVTGGTDPAEHVHREVIDVMGEKGIDISGREPRAITSEDIEQSDYAVTMGCSIENVRPEGWNGETETWEIPHPGGDADATRTQRDEIERRVAEFFGRIDSET
jgi:arsenate reductase